MFCTLSGNSVAVGFCGFDTTHIFHMSALVGSKHVWNAVSIVVVCFLRECVFVFLGNLMVAMLFCLLFDESLMVLEVFCVSDYDMPVVFVSTDPALQRHT